MRLTLLCAVAILWSGPALSQALTGDLDNLEPKLWVDPNGCQHWILDDGVEGYLTPRLNRDGTPKCPGVTQASWPAAQNNAPRFTQEATLWTDRLGCQHWVADHGGPGYLSARLDPQGRPICPGKQAPAGEQRSVTLGADALFDTNESDLRPEAVAELEAFGTKARALGKKRIRVEGHTDSRASDAYNQALSERRAKSVATYLAQNFGLEADTRGYGEGSPVASNATAEGRQANRRVDIILLD
ncbi:MAG: OmpA family protein [Pseudomonadota bacterium]